MARYALRRLLRGLITMWLVVTVVFVALRLSGDPAKAMLPGDASQAQIAAFNRKYGLDQPIPVQYTLYLRNTLKGDGAAITELSLPGLELAALP
jgi:peptide/nickel transport system permease protein